VIYIILTLLSLGLKGRLSEDEKAVEE